ncbi:MAG: PIN domain-containing protein [Acidobacteriota bacterium]
MSAGHKHSRASCSRRFHRRRNQNEVRPHTRDPKPLICAVTDGELRALSLQFSWGARKMDKMNFALDYFGRVPIESKEVMEAYAAIDFFSKSQGIKMGKNDLWIAATAYISGSQLITTDGDFDHLDPAFISVDKIEMNSGDK